MVRAGFPRIMPRFTQIPLAFLLAGVLSFSANAEVTVESEQIPNGLTFWANNPDPWPVTGTVTGKSQNARPAREFPYTLVIEKETRKRVATFHQENPQQPYRANVLVNSRPGDHRSRPNPKARYRFPFQSGQSFKVAQSFHGEISHTGKFEFAVDFMMPEGTPVCAARGGMVVKLENDFQKGAWDPALLEKANIIQILHDDGTIGSYGHLQYHGASVSLGQQVSAGDVIGHSGRTGMIHDPHLHFHVELPIDGNNFRSIAFKFEGPKRGGIVPEKDQTYTAP